VVDWLSSLEGLSVLLFGMWIVLENQNWQLQNTMPRLL